jgi:hypothetical protein
LSPKSNTAAEAEAAIVPVERLGALAQVKQIIQSVGWAESDPTERMAEFILGHEPEEWEQLFASVPNLRDNAGATVTVRAIRLAESDFEGGLGVYLLCEVEASTGFPNGLMSCSSQVSMIQLLKLWKEGKLPARLEIVRKEKKTKAGFNPIHLRYLGAA